MWHKKHKSCSADRKNLILNLAYEFFLITQNAIGLKMRSKIVFIVTFYINFEIYIRYFGSSMLVKTTAARESINILNLACDHRMSANLTAN